MEKYKIISLIFFIVGICLLYMGTYLYVKYSSLKKYGAKTKGTIKAVEKILSKNMSGANEIKYTYYLYTVEYSTEKRNVSAKSQDGIKRKYTIGETIDILYNTKKISEFYIIGENVNKKLHILFSFFGILFFSISILFYFK